MTITAAWDAFSMAYLDELLKEMLVHCKAVVEAHGIVRLVLTQRFMDILSLMWKVRINSAAYLHSVTKLKLTIIMPSSRSKEAQHLKIHYSN